MVLVKKVVVRSPNWIGDHVMAYDAYSALRSLYPVAEFTLVCPDGLIGLPFPELFHHQITIQKRRSFRESLRLSKRLRTESFDLAVLFASSARSAFPFALARIPRRVGFAFGGSSLFLNEALEWKGARSGLHKSTLYFDLVAKLAGQALVRRARPVEPAPAREDRIILAPGASIVLREWPHFRELLRSLRKEYPTYRVTLVGAASERRWLDELAPAIDEGVEDCIGATSLEQLTQLCRQAKLVVANDSGIAHISGSLAQAPTLVMFGPGNPEYIKPIGPRVYESRIDLKCSPCDKAYCKAPYGYQRCLVDLTVERVMEQVHQILG
jgi:heptosyltransferase II